MGKFFLSLLFVLLLIINGCYGSGGYDKQVEAEAISDDPYLQSYLQKSIFIFNDILDRYGKRPILYKPIRIRYANLVPPVKGAAFDNYILIDESVKYWTSSDIDKIMLHEVAHIWLRNMDHKGDPHPSQAFGIDFKKEIPWWVCQSCSK